MHVYTSNHIHSLTVCTAFAAGSNLPLVTVDRGLLPGGMVTYGNLRGLKELLDQAIREGRPYVYADNGYFKPGHYDGYYRCTWNALQHDGSGDASPQRWEALGKTIRPWRPSGSFVMVCPPGALYASMHGFDREAWLSNVLITLTANTDRRIVVRQKPTKGRDEPLWKSLRDCHALVAHSSNSAVEAVLYGVPVFCTDPCAAYAMGEPDVSRIESPKFPDRDQWAFNLAAAQWNLIEMRDGTCWAQLNK